MLRTQVNNLCRQTSSSSPCTATKQCSASYFSRVYNTIDAKACGGELELQVVLAMWINAVVTVCSAFFLNVNNACIYPSVFEVYCALSTSSLSTLLAISIHVTLFTILHFIVYHPHACQLYMPWPSRFIVCHPYTHVDCTYHGHRILTFTVRTRVYHTYHAWTTFYRLPSIPWAPYFAAHRLWTCDNHTYHCLLPVWGSLRLAPIIIKENFHDTL